MVTGSGKTAEKGKAVEQIIDALIKKHGGLRSAAREVGTNHARLANWREGQQREFLDTLERIRKSLGLTERQFWKMLQGKK
jgi:hypothetical protein